MDLGVFFRVIWRFRVVVAIGLRTRARARRALRSLASTSKAARPRSPTGETRAMAELHDADHQSRAGSPGALGLLAGFRPEPLRDAGHDLREPRTERRGQADHGAQTGTSGTVRSRRSLCCQLNNSSAAPLPLMTIAATTKSARSSAAVAERATAAFLDFLRAEQTDNGIPRTSASSWRDQARDAARLLKGRSKTTPLGLPRGHDRVHRARVRPRESPSARPRGSAGRKGRPPGSHRGFTRAPQRLDSAFDQRLHRNAGRSWPPRSCWGRSRCSCWPHSRTSS